MKEREVVRSNENKAKRRRCSHRPTLLHHASGQGDADQVRKLVRELNLDPHATDEKGWTPLHFACLHGRAGVARLLVEEFGVDPGVATTTHHCTPLFIACQEGHLDVAKFLVGVGGSKVCARNSNGWSPMDAAVNRGHVHVLEFLYSQGMELVFRGKNGCTPLHVACANGRCDVARFLLDKVGVDPAQCNHKGWNALHFAVKHGHLDLVALLVGRGRVGVCTPTTEHSCSPFFIACQEGHTDIARFLFAQRCDVAATNANGWNALHIASKNGHVGVVKFLADEVGLDLETKTPHNQCTALFIACQCGQLEVLRELWRAGANPEANSVLLNNPLHISCQNGHVEIVRFLVHTAGARPDAPNVREHTPLLYACKGGHLDCVRILQAASRASDTVLAHCAQVLAHNGHPHITAWLQTTGQWSPLMLAVDRNDEPVVRALLDQGVDVFFRCSDGASALTVAANTPPRAWDPGPSPLFPLIQQATAPWQFSTHHTWCAQFRQEVFQLLLVEHRLSKTQPRLPRDLWLVVISHLAQSYRPQ